MKHGIRFWQKKMSRKASHRKALLRSLISQLIIHEKITTTVAKAKFLKHAAEELINKAKLQTPQSDRIAHATLYSHSITLPKLKTTLVERYKNQLGGYIRILRYGFNSPGSDRAPKAIVELVGHAKDTVKLLASEGNRLSAVQKSLQEIEQEKYKKTGVILVDPFTRVAEEFALMRVREDLPGKVMKGLNEKELGLHKRIEKMEKAVNRWTQARDIEMNRRENAREQLQRKVDKLREEIIETKKGEIIYNTVEDISKKFSKVLRRENMHITDDYKADEYDADQAAELKKRRAFRKFSYRGIDLDQLLDLESEQLIELVNARQRRRFKRGLKRKPMGLIKKLRLAKKNAPANEKPETVKTHLRNMIVMPEMIGSVVGVYNGKTFTQVEIKAEMVGHYLGEFSISYKPVRHGRPGIGATHSSRFIPLK
ncbi:ribosomal protein S15 [Nowakowskiella sp. JEL0407]|nr:ribosomal protein S15 [Nowakowskiella sp. JEL0407]